MKITDLIFFPFRMFDIWDWISIGLTYKYIPKRWCFFHGYYIKKECKICRVKTKK